MNKNIKWTLQVYMDDQWRDMVSWTNPLQAKDAITYYLENWWNQAYRVKTEEIAKK